MMIAAAAAAAVAAAAAAAYTSLDHEKHQQRHAPSNSQPVP